jgi:eukaryotic-like serine/threonine-protein kinase
MTPRPVGAATKSMDTVLPKAEGSVQLQTTRISAEPRAELPVSSQRRPYGPGDVIDGKYELEALLGKGGMGEVWTARNTLLDVRRAVKLIRGDTGSADGTDRLLHEAQAAARLAEPAIVHVFDFGKTGSGEPYIVMEMLEGEDLMSVIRRRERLSPVKAVRVLLPLIRALCGAHAHGIVHRDLKPENIFLAKLPDGRVQPKLLDFGIAKLKNAIGLRLTTDGAVMGSPLYMSPEQARGEDVDERTDIWALCVVLYEAITGQTPFCGDDRAEVMRAVEDSAPARLSQHDVKSDSLWPILVRGLEKNRDERWQTMEELGRALARWLQAEGAVDDVTGASLEAVWFRTSRQSLFGSSSPPGRASLSGPTESLGQVVVTDSKPPLAKRLRRLALALPGRAKAWSATLARPGRTRWALVAALLGTSLASALLLSMLTGSEPVGAPTTSATPNPAPNDAPSTEPLPIEMAPIEVRLPTPPPSIETSEPRNEPPPAPPSSRAEEAARRAAARDVRARRPSDVEGAAKGESKEHRRSKLIDPYR